MVAAVIAAANELNQVSACVAGARIESLIRLLRLQASKSGSSHTPPMLLALHTRALQDDRWLVRAHTRLACRFKSSLCPGRFAPKGAAANDGAVPPTPLRLIVFSLCAFVASSTAADCLIFSEPSRPHTWRLELGTVAAGKGKGLASAHAAVAAVASRQICALLEEFHDSSFLCGPMLVSFEIKRKFFSQVLLTRHVISAFCHLLSSSPVSSCRCCR